MDDVISDTLNYTITCLEKSYNVSINKNLLVGKRLEDIVSVEVTEVIKTMVQQKNFFLEIPVKQNSQKVIKELKNKYDIYIVSAALLYPNSLYEKYIWLRENFNFIEKEKIVFCGDKRIIQGDILIDDNDFNLEFFSGRKIIYSSPHNLLDDRFERVKNWDEIQKILY